MKKKSTIKGSKFPATGSAPNFVRLLFFTVFMLTLGLVQATTVGSVTRQVKSVSGKVTDQSGASLPGVSVVIKGTSSGVITDTDGKYSISNLPANATLQFSFVGMKKQEVIVGDKTNLNVVLEDETIGLEEVVAIGYGTVTKKEVTGSVASISEKSFSKGDVTNPMSLIQGKVPGLSITNSSGGSPDGSFQIRLRGFSSLMGGLQPLVIVDGVVGAMDMVDPNQIASIDVLKDGSAAAIYGTRATNGVILITTKKPEIGNVKFDLSTYGAYQVMDDDDRFLNPAEYREAITDRGLAAFDKGESLNVLKEITQPQINKNYSFTASGGSKNLNFKGNIYFKDNEGIVIGTKSTTFTPSIFVSQSALNDKLKIDYRMTYSKIKNTNLGVGGAVNNALTRNPTAPIYEPDNGTNGGYYPSTLDDANPMAQVKERTYDVDEHSFSGDVNASYMLFNALKLRVHGNYFNSQDYIGTYYTKHYPNQGTNQASLSTRNLENLLLEPDFEYIKSFSGHTMKVLGGYSYSYDTNKGFNLTNNDFDYDSFLYNNIGSGADRIIGKAEFGSGKEANTLIAFYGRLMYNYNEKYLLSASLRREGSSRFGQTTNGDGFQL